MDVFLHLMSRTRHGYGIRSSMKRKALALIVSYRWVFND